MTPRAEHSRRGAYLRNAAGVIDHTPLCAGGPVGHVSGLCPRMPEHKSV